MKKPLLVIAMLIFGTTLGLAQTTDRSGSDNNSATVRTTGEPQTDHNWGWIGLLGLAGLAGLKNRKSEDARRLEGRGVNVKTV